MSSLEPIKAQDEELLRAVLQAQAPQSVDTESAWNALAPQLFEAQQTVVQRSSNMETKVENAKVQPRFRIRQRIALVAAVFLVPAVLLGANYGGNRYFWGGSFGDSGVALVGTMHLYSDINQQQQSNGITITVTKVYADAGRTLVAYEIKPVGDLAHRYQDIVLGSYDIFYQGEGDVQGVNSQCTSFPHDGNAQNCLLTLTPLPSAANPKNVSLTWKIHKMYLNLKSGYDVSEGEWAFTFSVPFHTNSLGAGGPFAKP